MTPQREETNEKGGKGWKGAESTSNFSNLVSECLPKHLQCLDVICCKKKKKNTHARTGGEEWRYEGTVTATV